MKLRNIAIAAASVAAVFSAGATGLAAADQTALKSTIAAGNYISIAGASAVQAGFESIIASVLKNPVYYVDTGTLTSANYIAVSGTLKTPTGKFTAGTQVVIHYRVAGGSFNGIYPVARNTAIDALDVTNCSATLGAGTSASPYVCVTRGPNSNATNSALNAAGLVPDAGISDVDPSFFTVSDNLEGETTPAALSASEVASFTATPIYALGFGIPLTRNVSSSLVLSQQIYSSIMTGAFSDWAQVPTVPSTDGGAIVICRRIAGSGTQAITNLFAGNVGCTGASVSTVDRSVGGAFTPTNGSTAAFYDVPSAVAANGNTGLIVIENNSSGDVRKCLDAAYFGGSYTTKDRDSKVALNVNFGSGGYKAIGVLGLDSLNKSTTTLAATKPATSAYGNANGAWQFRALGGNGLITGDNITAATASSVVAPAVTGSGTLPTLANIQTGDWPMQGYESYNVPSRTTGDKLAVVNQIGSAAQSAAVLRGVNTLSWVALSLPDLITGNTTASTDASNVLQAAHANNSLCAPQQRQY